jgi:hypothetical protein
MSQPMATPMASATIATRMAAVVTGSGGLREGLA